MIAAVARMAQQPSLDGAAAGSARAWATDVSIALALTAGTVAARMGIEQVVGGVAPFVLTFPAVMAATLLSGGRAGTLTAIGCQVLAILFVFPNWVSIHGGITTDLANLFLSTVALGLTIWATSSYRTTSALLRSRCEHRVHTLSLLIAEIDHRTKNNFQIAANLLAHQSISAFDPGVARELDKAAARLETIASVYQGLSADGVGRDRLNLADHLDRVVSSLRTGAAPDHVALVFRAEPIEVTVQAAVIIGLVVNEWVTNALKHAFGEAPGRIQVDASRRNGAVEIVVSDDGAPGSDDADAGRGGDLVSALAEVIGARMLIRRNGGTRCSLTYRPG